MTEKKAWHDVHEAKRSMMGLDASISVRKAPPHRVTQQGLMTIVMAIAAVAFLASLLVVGGIAWHNNQVGSAFRAEVAHLLENQTVQPRHGILPEPTKVEVVNQHNGDGTYLIGTFSEGDHLTEIGQLSDGRVLVCDSASTTFVAEEHCDKRVGIAFVVSADLMH